MKKVVITEADVHILLKVKAFAAKPRVANWLKEQEAAFAETHPDLSALMEELLALSSGSDWTDAIATVELED